MHQPSESSPPLEQLSAELERLAVHAIADSYDQLNWSFFRQTLKKPVIELSSTQARLGRWHHATRTLEISRVLLVRHSWGVLLEVLKHEMAHQFVDEVLGIHDEPAHGPAFRQVCAERGFDAAPAGIPTAQESSPEQRRVLERIAKLLALAESGNEHEAQNAALAAQRLMLKHNLQHVADVAGRRYAYRLLGKPTARVSEAERVVATILRDHFFVEVIWVHVWRVREGKRGSVLEVCGSEENLELASYTYDFLLGTAERLFAEFKRARKLRGNGDRRAYITGVMMGFHQKLAEQAKRHQAEGLVWVGDPLAKKLIRDRHPRTRTLHYGGGERPEAYYSGQEAGRKLVLHRGVSAGSSGGPTKLLGRG